MQYKYKHIHWYMHRHACSIQKHAHMKHSIDMHTSHKTFFLSQNRLTLEITPRALEVGIQFSFSFYLSEVKFIFIFERSPSTNLILWLHTIWPRFIHINIKAALRLIFKAPLPESSGESDQCHRVQSEDPGTHTQKKKWANSSFKAHWQPLALGVEVLDAWLFLEGW